MSKSFIAAVLLTTAAWAAQAQTPLNSSGTMLILPASGEVKHANDEARATFMIEEQDKDKSVAASRANLKMKQGMEIVRAADPKATLKTRGYYTYAVYADEPRPSKQPRVPTSWRVGQYLEVTTTNLDGLPKTVAAAQKILALNGLNFGLTDATAKGLDALRIDATYRNLNERLANIAKTMGRNLSDAVLETVDFEASGAYAQPENFAAKGMMRAQAASMDAAPVEEPSFEPGETTLSMRVVAKVRFK